jgi:histidyl-tRNA synthetase
MAPAKVKARLLKGMQDGLPEQAGPRRAMIAQIERVCQRFGFLPLDTPEMEALEVLLGPEPVAAAKADIFTFTNQDKEEVGLRYDLTVPLARVFSQYRQDLAQPFRRYQVGSAFRWDKPEPGRYREFLQFDIDTVGSSIMVADAEVLAVIAAIFTELGIERYQIKLSSRKLLNGVGEFAGADAAQARSIYRVIDKLDKFDRARIRQELGPGLTDASGDKIAGLGLSVEQIARIDQFLDLPNTGNAGESLAAARGLLVGNETAVAGLNEVEQVLSYAAQFGVPPEVLRFDLHLARGLGYYSGPVYETVLLDLPEYGTMFAGGRYDGLVDRFLGEGNGVPAVGASCGVDRLLAALGELERRRRKAAGEPEAEPRRATADVLVTVMDRERMPEYIAMVHELREAGINAELWLGSLGSFGKQMKYADKLGIPLAVIAGEDELAAGTVTLKDLELGRKLAEEAKSREEWEEQKQQWSIPRADLVSSVRLRTN